MIFIFTLKFKYTPPSSWLIYFIFLALSSWNFNMDNVKYHFWKVLLRIQWTTVSFKSITNEMMEMKHMNIHHIKWYIVELKIESSITKKHIYIWLEFWLILQFLWYLIVCVSTCYQETREFHTNYSRRLLLNYFFWK